MTETLQENGHGVPSRKYLETSEEMEQAEEAKIEGGENIPDYVKGLHIRAAPGFFDFPGQDGFKMNHWLDGYAVLARFEINGSKDVKYLKKYLRSDAYNRAMAAQKPCVVEFATKAYSDPNKGFFSRVISSLMPELTDNANATIYTIGKDLFTKADTGFFWKIDKNDLKSLEKCDAQKIHGVQGLSAHPIVDPATGDSWNIGFTLMPSPKYQVIKIPHCAGGNSKEMMKKAKVIATIPGRWGTTISSIHSFGVSENYVVFIEQPFGIITTKVAASIVKNDTCNDWLNWMPEDKCKFIIIEKATGKVLKTEYMSNETFHYLHTANIYEENSHIVLDFVTYASPSYLESLFMAKMRNNVWEKFDPAMPQRYVLPLIGDLKECPEGKNLITLDYCQSARAIRKGNQIILSPETFVSNEHTGFEMPMINPKYYGKKYRYFYGTSTITPTFFKGNLVKIDTLTKEFIVWKEGEENKPGEPVFIPNPNGTEEDDGVLVSAVTVNKDDAEDFLLFLRAKDLKELGRAYFKNSIVVGLHGIFLPSK